MSLKELNGMLMEKPYVAGFCPSKEDAKIFEQLFGNNVNVRQWVGRMASYYASERMGLIGTTSPKKAPAKADDDEIDLFGEETEEDRAALEAKKKKDEAKKKEKKVIIAKSSILMDIKPFDDETDLEALAKKLKAVEKDGLVWGAHKLVPVAYGLKKLQQLIVIEDDKVSGNDLEDIINSFEDEVQSSDIVAWNKI